MKKTAFIVLFFVLATLVGCKDKGYVPDHLLTEQEMIAIMTDVQIIEADINRQKTVERDRDPNDTTKVVPKDYVALARNYYAQLFEHYGITDTIFTQNMKYYTERPETLEKIMDSVMQRLMKEQATSSAQ